MKPFPFVPYYAARCTNVYILLSCFVLSLCMLPPVLFSQKGPALFVQNKQFQLWLHPWEPLLQEPTSQPWGPIQHGHSQSSDWSQPTMSRVSIPSSGSQDLAPRRELPTKPNPLMAAQKVKAQQPLPVRGDFMCLLSSLSFCGNADEYRGWGPKTHQEPHIRPLPGRPGGLHPLPAHGEDSCPGASHS